MRDLNYKPGQTEAFDQLITRVNSRLVERFHVIGEQWQSRRGAVASAS